MILDVLSVQAITALVVNVSGILFITETLLRRDEGAGRVWSLGFLAAMLTTLAYVVWAQYPDAWWPIAIGNATFVAGTGCMWLGCRRFNGRRMLWSSVLVAAAALAAFGAVWGAGADGGDWAGALWMFVPLVAFSGAGAFECMRGSMRISGTAWVLGGVLALESVFFVVRTAIFLAAGADSEVFGALVGTIPTSFLTVILTIVAVVATSVLRATRTPVRGYLRTPGFGPEPEGFLERGSFDAALTALCGRAERRSELVAVTAVRIDDLDQISGAFGSDVARDISDTWRTGVRLHAPSNAFIAEDGPTGLLLATLTTSASEARRQAAVIYRGLFDDLGLVDGGVIPVLGIGVALSDVTGYEASRLSRVARDAAMRAAVSIESSVLIGGAD
ncbi:hypothetical protein [Microbacterium pygmaeum]|uniref:GGDEF domain-containing protein, diguanylate cyclase (C-di-GMP synthetase) or its enzymatically inactive variants n=1 Tax=Microbacterium pygmaeum TaxID=370764 RepID=A0A1G8BD12_9MICO|nr:hypothetical protein [Microbacterium pygmaeum]SDH30480.1 GGDEF domain-containing protein, diguanylate cyclase (c-di-GMP synthetase) or its enzymatically inactive variants [Microbacterium pygmaeum]